MKKHARLAGILAVAGALGMAACGGGGGSSTPITLSISANANSLETFQTVQFTATVTGTSNTAVTWQLSCTAAGSVCGSLSSTGLYTAPNTVPTVATATSTDPAMVTVTAISQANASVSQSVQFQQVFSLNQQALTMPAQLGSSGSNVDANCATPAPGFCFGGTLGSLLTNNATPPAVVILSNNHVLGLSDGGAVGQNVTQPGIIETNCSLTGTTVVANVSTIINLQTQSAPHVDVTTAQIIAGEVDATGSILELGALNGSDVPQPAPPAGGSGITTAPLKLLAKSGRTTGLTCAAVDSVGTTMGISVGYTVGCSTTSFSVIYDDEVVVANMSNGQSFIGDGDSGSLAVDALTAEPVALMFAGSDTDAVGNPVADVLNALHTSTGHTYTFVGGAQHTVPGCSLPGLSSVKVTPQSAAALPASEAHRAQTAGINNGTQIMNTPGVSAFGQGGSLDAPNEPAVMIFVAPGASHTGIPATVDGVRTRLIESNSASVRGALSPQQSAQLGSQSEQAQAIEIPVSAIEQTKSVKEQHVMELMSDPAVVGVGVSASLDSPGDPALMIYVLKGKTHNAIPASIDGVRTRIKETSPFRANVAHPAKSTTTAAGCHVPKSAPATTLTAAPASLQPSAPSPSVQPIALTTTQR